MSKIKNGEVFDVDQYLKSVTESTTSAVKSK
jgi:hypothetical protein